MGVSTLRSSPKMTVDEFHAFVEGLTDDDRKWELIDGEAIVNASPVRLHQMIVFNIAAELNAFAEEHAASWVAIPGTNVVAPGDIYNAPEPDVLVVPAGDWDSWKAMDGLAVFEILSPSTRSMDLRRKPPIYARSPTIADCVVIDPKAVCAVHHARGTGWQPRTIRDIDASIVLESIGVSLPLASVYHRTPLARRPG
jgi:Uma2 family endonuclease